MKTYFECKRWNGKTIRVEDYKDKEFASYKVTDTSRCFNDLDEAILYCIGSSKGNRNDQQLTVLIDSFITMINK